MKYTKPALSFFDQADLLISRGLIASPKQHIINRLTAAIHHIFPQDWCEARKIDVRTYDTVINKTPLSYRTNRIIGGVDPSKYLAKLEQGKKNAAGQIESPPIAPEVLDSYLASHCISPQLLRADDFDSFMKERRKALLNLIGTATGHLVAEVADTPDEGEDVSEAVARDSGLVAAW